MAAVYFILLLGLLSNLSFFVNAKPNTKVKWDGEYDYVIVGAGAAGSTLAGRLSEDPKNDVLVIEAGFDDLFVPFIEVPLATRFVLDPAVGVNWDFRTEPMTSACRSFIENRSFWAQGKVLGGTSSINGMAYIRGSRADFDAWAAEGNEGWSFDDVLPYFKKSERNLNTMLNPDIHGFTGPWVIEDNNASPDAVQRFLDGGAELGYNVLEPNDPSHTGFSRFQKNSFLGRRMNLAKTFLKPNQGRPNLTIKTLAYVTKVLIKGKKAEGVQYVDLQTNQIVHIKAKKEVIVSAGALQTPKVLMLSGIGPKDHLESFNIPVLADLPVGKALEDHYLVPLMYTFNQSITPSPIQLSTFQLLSQYVFTGQGPWSTSGVLTTAFLRPDNSSFDGTYETLQLQLFNIMLGADGPAEATKIFGFKPNVAQAIFGPIALKAGITISVTLMHPQVRGRVTLRSLNPLDKPVITMNYLEKEADLEELVKGIRVVQDLMKTTRFQELGPELAIDTHPNCAQHPADSDDYWRCYTREMTSTEYHYSTTARMGSNPVDSVVDSQLRVHGFKNLRVVDASVMPIAVTANTMATTVMIAEKAADIIQKKKKV